MTKDKKAEGKRIPYNQWANSQLSISKYYGGIKIDGVHYKLDYDNCKTKGEGVDKKYFPDLVEVLTPIKPIR